MAENTDEEIRASLDEVYRTESRRILATLIRLLGDFDLAEDALHDAFRAGLERWPNEGVPANPRAWLISTGRFKAIDAMRRRVRFDASQSGITEQLYADTLLKEVQPRLRIAIARSVPVVGSDDREELRQDGHVIVLPKRLDHRRAGRSICRASSGRSPDTEHTRTASVSCGADRPYFTQFC